MSPAGVEVNLQEEAEIITQDKRVVMEGMTTWRNRINGFKVIDLEFKASPRKRDPEWLAVQRRGIPKAEFNREYGSKWVVYDGKPVYDTYDPDIHDLKGPIYALRRCRLISGWDGGPHDVNLAWALGLAFPDECAVLIIDEFWVQDGDVEGFVDVVRTRLNLEWFKISGGFSIHVADPQVFTPNNITKTSMADVMRKHGMAPIPGAVSWSARRQGVIDLMKENFKSKGEGRIIPKFRVHDRCEMIRAGLGGGYHYPKMAAGVGGQFKPQPVKNEYSHLLNSVEYLCSKLAASGMFIPFEGRPLPRVSII